MGRELAVLASWNTLKCTAAKKNRRYAFLKKKKKIIIRIGFCSGYLSHPRTEQKWYPKWNSNLPKHWDTVIEKQGDYIEGL
jgi:hypothetical protein